MPELKNDLYSDSFYRLSRKRAVLYEAAERPGADRPARALPEAELSQPLRHSVDRRAHDARRSGVPALGRARSGPGHPDRPHEKVAASAFSGARVGLPSLALFRLLRGAVRRRLPEAARFSGRSERGAPVARARAAARRSAGRAYRALCRTCARWRGLPPLHLAQAPAVAPRSRFRAATLLSGVFGADAVRPEPVDRRSAFLRGTLGRRRAGRFGSVRRRASVTA